LIVRQKDKVMSGEKVVQDTTKNRPLPNQFFNKVIVNNIICLIKNSLSENSEKINIEIKILARVFFILIQIPLTFKKRKSGFFGKRSYSRKPTI
jgi:hypothetical protein